MMLIDCPWCGARDEAEFTWGGEAHIHRPAEPDDVSDETWGRYLFMRQNPKGIHHERWCHTYGCYQWFNIARDTVSHKIIAVYPIGQIAPELKDDIEYKTA